MLENGFFGSCELPNLSKINWDFKKCHLNVMPMMNYIMHYKESNASLDGPHVVKFTCINLSPNFGSITLNILFFISCY
jgi:hypothetical protein